MIEDMVTYVGGTENPDYGCIQIAMDYLEVLKNDNNAQIRSSLGVVPRDCMGRKFLIKQ